MEPAPAAVTGDAPTPVTLDASIRVPGRTGADPSHPLELHCGGPHELRLDLWSEVPTGRLPITDAFLTPAECSPETISAQGSSGVLVLASADPSCFQTREAGGAFNFTGWRIDVTEAEPGTYTWTRTLAWSEPAPSTSTSQPVAPQRYGEVTVTAVLQP
ncbi:hypothetical protein CLV92_11395 [Kineococcus xinjiangensis]|uniref:Uncharacterized protein n=1 Tax=Kineococcus xinjiangensis TaxID=512762 RepID=A0A2S6IEQ4_9ACTN|nr:hypothetical protein CLV92_11395 [Kineococcus xinjiangensis]